MVQVTPLHFSSPNGSLRSVDTLNSVAMDYFLDELTNAFQRAQYFSDASASSIAEFAESLFQGLLSEKEGLTNFFEKSRLLNLILEAADPRSYHPLFHTSLIIILSICQRFQKPSFPLYDSNVSKTMNSELWELDSETQSLNSPHSTIEFYLSKFSESLSDVLIRKDCFHIAIKGLYLLYLSDDRLLFCSEKLRQNLINALNFWNPERKNSSTMLSRSTFEIVSENGSAMAGLNERVAFDHLILFTITLSSKLSNWVIPCLSSLFLSPSLFVEVLVHQVLLGVAHSEQILVHILIHLADVSVIIQIVDFYYVHHKDNVFYHLPLLFWQWLLSFGIVHHDPVISSISTQITKTTLQKLPCKFDPLAFLQICFSASEPPPELVAELMTKLLDHINPIESRFHAGLTCLHHSNEVVTTLIAKYISSHLSNVPWHPLAIAFRFPPEFEVVNSISPSQESLEGMHDHVDYLLSHLKETWKSSRGLKSLALLSKHSSYNECLAPFISQVYELWLSTSFVDPSTYLLQILINCDLNMPQKFIKSSFLYSLQSIYHIFTLLSMESTNAQLRFQISQLFHPPLSSLPQSSLDTDLFTTPDLLNAWSSDCLTRFSQTYIQPLTLSQPQEHTALLFTIQNLRLVTVAPSSAQFILSHPFQLCRYLSIPPGCPEDIECQAVLISFLARLVKLKAPYSGTLTDEVFMTAFDSVLWPHLFQNGVNSVELSPLIQACFDYLESHAYDSRCVVFLKTCIGVHPWIPSTLRCLLNKPEIKEPWLISRLVTILREERKPSVVARHAIAILLSQNTDDEVADCWLVNGRLHWLMECMDQGHNVWRLIAKLLSGGHTRGRINLIYSELNERCLKALPIDPESWFCFVHFLVLKRIEKKDELQVWWESGLHWLQRPCSLVNELILRSWMHVGYDDPGWILMQQQCYTSLKFFLTHAKNQDVMAVICSLFARHSTIWMTQLEPEIIFFVKSVERPTYALLDFLIQFLSLTSNSNEWLPQICTSWLPYLASQLQYEDTQGTLAIFQVLILSIHHGMVLSEPNWINLLIPFLPKYPDHVSYLLLPLCHGADKASIVQGIFSNAHVRITSSILTLLCSTQTSLQHPKIHAYFSANLTDIPISIYKSLIQTSKDLTYWIDSIDLLNKLLLTCLSKPTDKIIEALIYLATFSSGRLYFSQKKVAGQILKFIDKKLNKCRDSKVYLEIIKGFSRYFDLHSSILYDIDIILDLTPHLSNHPTLWIILRNLCFSKSGRIKLASWIQHTLVRCLTDGLSPQSLYCILQILWVHSYHEYGKAFRSYLRNKLLLLRQRYGEYSISLDKIEGQILNDQQLNQVENKDIVFLIEVVLEFTNKTSS